MALLRDRLQQLIEPALEALGFELVLLEYSPGIKTGTLRLFIDSADGIQLADCERASREIAALLDVEDPIEKAYQLEVSSPGLDRPLTKLAHFQRFVGEKARIQTVVPIGGRKKFLGPIRHADAQTLQMDQDGATVNIPMADIERARLVPNYARELARKNS